MKLFKCDQNFGQDECLLQFGQKEFGLITYAVIMSKVLTV